MTKNLVGLCLGVLCLTLSACGSSPDPKHAAVAGGAAAAKSTDGADTTSAQTPVPGGKLPPPSAILGRKQVPILCYHQIRDWKPTDSRSAKDYIMPIADFRAQMKMLHDSGYHTILPDQLYAYLTTGAPLPEKPVMLTFDDNDEDHYTIAYPELKKYNFKAVYFVMTITLGKLPHYMTKDQVKELYTAGNVIGSHTWDHHSVKKYQGKDWEIQIDKPTKQLEAITGAPIRYFAYPFGLWNREAFPELRKRGFVAAFGLADRRDETDPLMCIRRIIVAGGWSLKTFNAAIHSSFK